MAADTPHDVIRSLIILHGGGIFTQPSDDPENDLDCLIEDAFINRHHLINLPTTEENTIRITTSVESSSPTIPTDENNPAREQSPVSSILSLPEQPPLLRPNGLSCPSCDMTFGKRHHLENHQRTIHPTNPDSFPFRCRNPQCSAGFKSLPSRSSHEKAHHGEYFVKKGIMKRCQYCVNHFFENNSTYQTHYRKHLAQVHNISS